MSKLSLALSILVLHLTFPSIQAQSGESKTGTAMITGRVTLNGEPARGVMVILQNQISWSINPPRASTDENGRFSFTAVAAGTYSIAAVAPGYISPEGKYIGVGLNGEKIAVDDSDKIEDVDLEIKRGGGVITGRIIDSQGRSVIEETITLNKLDRDNRPQGNFSLSPNFDMWRTDDRGVYRIYGLFNGRYLVSVGYAQKSTGQMTLCLELADGTRNGLIL